MSQNGRILTSLILGRPDRYDVHPLIYTQHASPCRGFYTTPAVVKLSLSFNALAFGLSQLVHGPLSDRFGCRPIMLGGMTGFIIFSLSCAFARSINQLIAARVFQGDVGIGRGRYGFSDHS